MAKIVYGLLSTGVVTIEPARTRARRGELATSLVEAEGLLAAADWRGAEQAAREVAADHPDVPEPHLLEGRALAAQGRMRAATEAFARAAQLEPTASEAHFHLGFTAARIGDLDRARHAWETFLALGHGDVRAPLALRGTEALRALAGVLEDGPYPPGTEHLGLTHASTAEGAP